MRYLIDTNWVIECLRLSPRHLRRVATLEPEGVGVSDITMAELWVGVHRVDNPQLAAQRMLGYTSRFDRVEVDIASCERFGLIKAGLQQAGQTIEDFDILLAATALRHDLTLLTDNVKHFDRVGGLAIESISGPVA